MPVSCYQHGPGSSARALLAAPEPRKLSYEALLGGLTPEQLGKLDTLLVVDPKTNVTPLAWVREITTAPKADNVRGLIARLQHVRSIGIAPVATATMHHSRFRQLAHERRASPAHLLARYAPSRRRAILAALIIELEARLIDAALDMADRMIGGSFTRGGNAKQRVYAATTRDVGRLMWMFSQTIDALGRAQDGSVDAFTAVDDAVGWHKLLAARPQVDAISALAEEDPLVRAADRWITLRKFAPALLEAISFKAGPGSASTLAAIEVLLENARTERRIIPDDAAMPFKKEWRTLVRKGGGIDRRLYETAAMAHVRNKWRSGDIWVEGSTNYRRFDSYLLPQSQVPPIASALQLPATADEWIKTRAAELDWRLKGFASRLAKGKLEGVRLEGGKLSVTPVRGSERPYVIALTAKIDALMPHVRITELLHDVAKQTGFLSGFTNLRTHETHDIESALLATILADGSNLGLARMAEAS